MVDILILRNGGGVAKWARIWLGPDLVPNPA
jgi:hypothetical protein